jgi:acyl-coenzyme A synthetase/AMP-(fatty) acid ligase
MRKEFLITWNSRRHDDSGAHPNRQAISGQNSLIFIDSKISYKQLDDMANRFANALIDLGVKSGDKVAMLMPNMPQLVAATYGAWRAGQLW